MVDVEERGLQIGLHPVRGKEAADAVLGAVLDPRGPLVAGHVQQVAVEPHELRERNRVDCAPLEGGRPHEVAAGDLDLGERVECVDVAGEGAERLAEVRGRGGETAAAQLELAELHLRPGGGLLLVGGRIAGEQQGVARRVEVADQLAPVRDAGVRRDPGLQAGHRVEGLERLAVAAELEQRVARLAVAEGGRRGDPQRLPSQRERE